VRNTTQEWTIEETASRKTLYRTAKCHFRKTFKCALTGSGNNGRPEARWNGQIPVWIEDRQTNRHTIVLLGKPLGKKPLRKLCQKLSSSIIMVHKKMCCGVVA